ncbi:MAG: hypothetical protein WCO56_22325 [Verrucomicrobiota bacterium]
MPKTWQPQLILQQATLAPGDEWSLHSTGWRMLCVQRGMGYWISPTLCKEFSQGQTLVLSPASEGCLRGSQIGEVELKYFMVDTKGQSGFFTLLESHLLEASATQLKYRELILNADHPVSAQLARVCELVPTQPAMATRGQLLAVFASLFAGELPPMPVEFNGGGQAVDRFLRLIAQMSVAQFLECTTEDLAAVCGCSTRHLARMFQEHLGASFKHKQIALRER